VTSGAGRMRRMERTKGLGGDVLALVLAAAAAAVSG
jgi:hypothetical protein